MDDAPTYSTGQVLPRGRRGRPDHRDRFTPTPTSRFRLGDDDWQILRLLVQHRIVTSRQLLLTIGRRRHPRGFLRRLQKLFHEEVLARPRHQVQPGQPARHMVYALGIKGHKALYPEQWKGPHPNHPRDWRQRDRRIRWPAIEHELTLTETLLSMQLAAADRGWQFGWAAGDRFRDETRLPRYVDIPTRGGSVRLPLNPDAFVTAEALDVRHHWFVEVDMSTEPHERRDLRRSSILQKMLAYQHLNATSLRTVDRRQNRFNVLFVTTTAKRAQTMRTIAQQIDPKRKGAHFFLFSTHNRCRLEEASLMLSEPRWWTAKAGYDIPRPLILGSCPRCHQLVDPSNESHEIIGQGDSPTRVVLAPASTPLPGLNSDGAELTHARCAAEQPLAAFLE